jgi:SAM-dependent methyltransferase
MTRTQEQWVKDFSQAKHGHILWDGKAEDPYNPIHAYNSAHKFVNWAKNFGFFKDGNRILDLGCGNGRFGIPFSEMNVQYTGIDPMREQILFCNKTFKDYNHLRFIHCDVRNAVFNQKGSVPPEQYQFPFPDGTVDDVIAYSVFTHLQTLPVAQHYISEIKRVLKVGGKFFCTWYRSPANPAPDDNVGRTVYNEWDIMSMMSGFTCQFCYGGHTDLFYDQWGMFCTKA